MIKGRDFQLTVSLGLSEAHRPEHTVGEKSCGLKQQQLLYHRLSDFLHLCKAAVWELEWFIVLSRTAAGPTEFLQAL